MSMFGGPTTDQALAERIAALEARMNVLSQAVDANAQEAASSIGDVAGEREAGDQAALDAVNDAVAGSERRTNDVASLLGAEITVRSQAVRNVNDRVDAIMGDVGGLVEEVRQEIDQAAETATDAALGAVMPAVAQAQGAAADALSAVQQVRAVSGIWEVGKAYATSPFVDVVVDAGWLFKCRVAHVATLANRPVPGIGSITAEWEAIVDLTSLPAPVIEQLSALKELIDQDLGDDLARWRDSLRKVFLKVAGNGDLVGMWGMLRYASGGVELVPLGGDAGVGVDPTGKVTMPGFTMEVEPNGDGIVLKGLRGKVARIGSRTLQAAGFVLSIDENERPSVGLDGDVRLIDIDPDGDGVIINGRHGPVAKIGSRVAAIAGHRLEVDANERRTFGYDNGTDLVVREDGDESPIGSGSGAPAIDVTTPHIGIAQGSIDAVNAALPAVPTGVIPAPRLSIDAATYGRRTASAASSIAVVGHRVFDIIFGDWKPDDLNDIAEGPGSFAFLRYCDDIDRAEPIWHEALYIVPALPAHQVHDPAVTALKDGRLLVTVANVATGYKRAGFGLIIENPLATRGQFNVGRINYLGLGIPGFGRVIDGEVIMPLDEWRRPNDLLGGDTGQGKHLCKLTFSADLIAVAQLGDLPRNDATPSFDETSVAGDSAGGKVATFRSSVGAMLTRFTPLTGWSAPVLFPDFPTPDSRGCIIQCPSGRHLLVLNNSPLLNRRPNPTACFSEDGGRTWPFKLMFDPWVPTSGGSLHGPNYPSVAFHPLTGDPLISLDRGRVSNNQPPPPVTGAGTVIFLLDEDRICDPSGGATIANAVKLIPVAHYF